MTEQIVSTYTELMAGIQAQVGELGLKLTDFDDLAGWPSGMAGKVFGLLQVKRLSAENIFVALDAAGLRLKIDVDPERAAKIRERIAANYLPRQANQARNGHAASPASTAVLSRVFKPLARMGGRARWANKSKKERSQHMKAIANARWKKQRQIAKKRKRAARVKAAAAAHHAANEAANPAVRCGAP